MMISFIKEKNYPNLTGSIESVVSTNTASCSGPKGTILLSTSCLTVGMFLWNRVLVLL